MKFLGAKNVLVANNIFRAPMNYAVYAGSDASFGEGVRPLQDIVIANNQITDLITSDRYGNPYPIDTAILISQWDAAPENVLIRANTLAQRTATTGKSWSDLRLRGIAGENRQFRLQPDGSVVWYDGTRRRGVRRQRHGDPYRGAERSRPDYVQHRGQRLGRVLQRRDWPLDDPVERLSYLGAAAGTERGSAWCLRSDDRP
ncbi:MAG: hypothetical protein HWD60_00135 [Defluviicoccus sp.]|nr:MAG: hypothetical protein HWD60_00135 [Defluviicoccus sp.]